MIKFVLFIKRIYIFVLFIIMEALAMHYYSHSTSYTKANMLAVSNVAVGGIYSLLAEVDSYFSLRSENRMLVEEIARLQNKLAGYQEMPAGMAGNALDSEFSPYMYSSARVINNSISRQENYLTIDRGLRDGVEGNMAVLTPDGKMVGYTLVCSEKYSVCMSVLHTDFRTSGKVKGGDFFGSIYWKGLDHTHVILSEIPKYAVLNHGDTIVTTNYSSIFPPGMMIGTIESWELNNATFFDVQVKLAAQISKLKEVVLVQYMDAAERTSLEREAAHSIKL